MLLFDIIRDWFVMYIWGGVTSNGDNFRCIIGELYQVNEVGENYVDLGSTTQNIIKIGEGSFPDIWDDAGAGLYVNAPLYMSLGDWLSTTSTIIVMILLCVVFGLMVRWLFRLTAGLLRGN